VLEALEVLAAAPEDARREQAAERTPSSTCCPPSGLRSNEYHSQSSGFTRWKRASSHSP
jgi:hypothetical protein